MGGVLVAGAHGVHPPRRGSLALYVALPIALFAYFIIQAPHLWGNESWRFRLQFLVFRFRPDRWWAASGLLLRSFMVGLVVSISPSDGYAQASIMPLLLMAYIGFIVWAWPFRYSISNALELFQSAMLVITLTVAGPFLDKSIGSSEPRPGYLELLGAIVFFTAAVHGVVFLCGAYIRATDILYKQVPKNYFERKLM